MFGLGLGLTDSSVLGGGGGSSGIEFAGYAQGQFIGGGSPYTISLTNLSSGVDTTVKAGDLILVFTNHAVNSTTEVTISGYTRFYHDYSNNAADFMASAFFKVANGTETSVSVVTATDSGFTYIGSAYVFRGVDTATEQPFGIWDAAPSTAGASATTQITMPNITTNTNNAVVISVGYHIAESAFTVNDPGYLNFYQWYRAGTSSPNVAGLGIGWGLIENAGLVTGLTHVPTTDNVRWGARALTMALRPA